MRAVVKREGEVADYPRWGGGCGCTVQSWPSRAGPIPAPRTPNPVAAKPVPRKSDPIAPNCRACLSVDGQVHKRTRQALNAPKAPYPLSRSSSANAGERRSPLLHLYSPAADPAPSAAAAAGMLRSMTSDPAGAGGAGLRPGHRCGGGRGRTVRPAGPAGRRGGTGTPPRPAAAPADPTPVCSNRMNRTRRPPTANTTSARNNSATAASPSPNTSPTTSLRCQRDTQLGMCHQGRSRVSPSGWVVMWWAIQPSQ